jgi:hypothetical protein
VAFIAYLRKPFEDDLQSLYVHPTTNCQFLQHSLINGEDCFDHLSYAMPKLWSIKSSHE